MIRDVETPDVVDGRIDQPGVIAIVHDYLTQLGGAERVVLAMHRAFPAAPIYTSLYEPELTFPEFRNADVRPSYLNRAQFLRRQHRFALPLLPHVFSSLEVDAKVVLCSSSGWAHGIRTKGTKLVYCHSPARWLYKSADYFRKVHDVRNQGDRSASPGEGIHTSFVFRNSLRAITPGLQRWDRKAAASASEYYTTSSTVSKEISSLYGIQPTIIPPPPSAIDGPPEKPPGVAKEGFFLVVSRLLPYKNVDRIFDVFAERRDLDLVVVGSGPLRKPLQELAGSNIYLLGSVADRELCWLYGGARALIAPAHEDYGLTPLEAANFGTPTLALKSGGYLDTVSEGTSGYFFEDLNAGSISTAIDRLNENPLNGDEIREHASQYSEERFANTLRRLVSRHVT